MPVNRAGGAGSGFPDLGRDGGQTDPRAESKKRRAAQKGQLEADAQKAKAQQSAEEDGKIAAAGAAGSAISAIGSATASLPTLGPVLKVVGAGVQVGAGVAGATKAGREGKGGQAAAAGIGATASAIGGVAGMTGAKEGVSKAAKSTAEGSADAAKAGSGAGKVASGVAKGGVAAKAPSKPLAT